MKSCLIDRNQRNQAVEKGDFRARADPQPSTLNPQPQALRYQPSTLNLKPYTLNPQRCH